MPLPVAHGLVGASVVAAVHPTDNPRKSWKPLLIGALLAISPDFDFILTWGFGLEEVHRTFTHSIAFAALVGWGILQLKSVNMREAVAYGLAFLSHTLLDFSATQMGKGVALLWPITDQKYKLGILSFSEFRDGFSTLHVFFANWEAVLRICAFEFIVFMPVLLLIYLYRHIQYTRITAERCA